MGRSPGLGEIKIKRTKREISTPLTKLKSLINDLTEEELSEIFWLIYNKRFK